MQLKNMSEKAQNGFNHIKKLPMQKIILGTVVIIMPGALLVTGTYFISNKLIKRYNNYKKVQELPKSFIKWFSIEASTSIKNLSIITGQSIIKTTRSISKVMNKNIKKK